MPQSPLDSISFICSLQSAYTFKTAEMLQKHTISWFHHSNLWYYRSVFLRNRSLLQHLGFFSLDCLPMKIWFMLLNLLYFILIINRYSHFQWNLSLNLISYCSSTNQTSILLCPFYPLITILFTQKIICNGHLYFNGWTVQRTGPSSKTQNILQSIEL